MRVGRVGGVGSRIRKPLETTWGGEDWICRLSSVRLDLLSNFSHVTPKFMFPATVQDHSFGLVYTHSLILIFRLKFVNWPPPHR